MSPTPRRRIPLPPASANDEPGRARRLLAILSRWPATIAVAAAIFALSSIPQPQLPAVPLFPHADKLAHAIEYFALGFCLYRSLRHTLYKRPALPAIIAPIAGALYGGLDEYHQSFSGRTPDLLDLAADVAGLLIAIAVVSLISRRRQNNAR